MQRIPVLLTHMPGLLGDALAAMLLSPEFQSRWRVLDVALASPGATASACDIADQAVRLLPAGDSLPEFPPGTIAAGFAGSTDALDTIRVLSASGIPFVLGSVATNMDDARALVGESGGLGVLSPTMALPTILFQRTLRQFAAKYGRLLEGYQFGVLESHHQPGIDEGNSARVLLSELAALGLPVTGRALKRIRDTDVQHRALSVPPEHLDSHAYHFIEVASPTGDVRFELSQRVHGHRVHADGARLAMEFVARRAAEGVRGRLYTLEDVVDDSAA